MEIEDESPPVSREELAEFSAALAALPRAAIAAGLWQPYDFGARAGLSSAASVASTQRRAVLSASVERAGDEAGVLWGRAHELLRHYWSCVPPSSPRAAAKARKMRAALTSLRPQLGQEPLVSAMAPAVDRALQHAEGLMGPT